MRTARPRPRTEGTENPAFTGVDKRTNIPSLMGAEGSVVPNKLAAGAVKARARTSKSARAAAAKSMIGKGQE